MCKMISLAVVLAASLSATLISAATLESDGWSPKFYDGLEAVGDVVFNPVGYRKEKMAIGLKWTDGMAKFGAAKIFERMKGSAEWTVSAQVKCAPGGRAACAVQFFNKDKRTLGVFDCGSCSHDDWTLETWKVVAPSQTSYAEVHLLSIDKPPVAFACVEVSAVPAPPPVIPPLAMRVLPVEWNRHWNGGLLKMQNFSDAPIPVTVLFRGKRNELKSPVFELDLPDELELKDAFCPFMACYGHETPTSTVPFRREGRRYVRCRFEGLRVFANATVRTQFGQNDGIGVSLVIGPKKGGESLAKTFQIACRAYDGGRLYDEHAFDMVFRPIPPGLRQTKDFTAFCWLDIERCISDDEVLKTSLKAYEAAGIRSLHPRIGEGLAAMRPHPRIAELRKIFDKRPNPYVYAVGLGRHSDLWRLSDLRLTEEQFEAMGGNLCERSDNGRYQFDARTVCPTFFTTSPELRRHIDKTVAFWLSLQQVKSGDMVTLDMEPWHSDKYCFCERCLKAFAAFAKLDHVPTMEEARSMPEVWAEFRVRHCAESIRIIHDAVKKYNPNLQIFDYDYVIMYGNPESRANRIRICAKDTLMNEEWIDGHLCSYYHKIDRVAFDSMKNNVRNLKKPYKPLAAIGGVEDWSAFEILSPRQIRQLTLAAFVNGCPGYGFFPGCYLTGEILMAMMEAQDVAARYESLPWGKVDGKTVPTCENELFAYASTVRPDGTEVIALFNYDPKNAIRVDVAGTIYEMPPYETKFIESVVGSQIGDKTK